MTISDLVCDQHRRVERLLHALRVEGYRRNRILLELLGELTTHLAVEGNLLLPVARDAVGVPLARELAEARALQDKLRELAEPSTCRALFTERLEAVALAFELHTRRQELVLLPSLETALDASEREELADDMERFASALGARCRPYVRPSQRLAVAG